jgi:AcrR family transcriptional regulator
MANSEKIINGFIDFQLMNGRVPHSVLELTKKLKITEKAFYEDFSSLDAIIQQIPLYDLKRALERLHDDPNYQEFTEREKLLGLFFTLFEEMKSNRSYYLFNYSKIQKIGEQANDWKPFLSELESQADGILSEAKKNEEIKDRPLIGEHYSKGFKLVFTYLFRVWLNDDSQGFTTTDAAIEKSINLSFDMLQSNQFDSLLDFGKFAIKTKVF